MDCKRCSTAQTSQKSESPATGKARVFHSKQTNPSKTSFYRRQLPTGPQALVKHVPFTSPESQSHLSSSILSGYASNYFFLADQHLTQSEPAFCGLATLCLILNAAAVDPQRQWKGSWRWYDQDMLDCCRSLESVKEVGITLDEFACLAQCNTLHAEIVRESTLEEFRHDVKKSTSSQGTIFLAVAYSRKVLEQTGEGHFSPLAAYSGEENDLVLVLDVARFKYGSYWIPLEAMWRAMNTVDGASGKMRGYCRLRKTGLTTDDPESISVVKSLMDKGSFKALLATKCLQQSPTLRDLQRSEELQEYARLIELIPVESVGQGNGSSQTVVEARQDALLEQISLMDLFFLALHEYLVDTGYSQMETMGEISGSKEVMAAINSLKTQFSALHESSCQEKSTDESNTSVV